MSAVTFLGKWQISYSGTPQWNSGRAWNPFSCLAYFSWSSNDGTTDYANVLWPWYGGNYEDYAVNSGNGPYTPGASTHVAILQWNNAIYLQLNNGWFLGPPIGALNYVSTVPNIASAQAFDLPVAPNFPMLQPFSGSLTMSDGTPVGFTPDLGFWTTPYMVAADGYAYDQMGYRNFANPTVFSFTPVTPVIVAILGFHNGDNQDLAFVDFSGVDFSDCSLKNANFSNCNLTGAKFTNANLSGANLTNTNLTNADFTGANLSGANLSGASTNGTILTSSQCIGTVFPAGDLTGIVATSPATLYNSPAAAPTASSPRTSLSGRTINYDLIGLDWSLLDLTQAVIRNIPATLTSWVARYTLFPQNLDLSTKVMVGAKLSYSDMTLVNFNSANLQNAQMDNAFLWGADLQRTNLSGAVLTASYLDYPNMNNVAVNTKLGNAYMYNANLSNAKLDGADFTGAHFYGDDATVKGDGTSLTGTDFSGALLSGLDFSNTILTNTVFNNSQLINCKFAGASLVGVKFEGAYLQGADFSLASRVESANFSGAVLAIAAGGMTVPGDNQNPGWPVTWKATQLNSDKFANNCTLPDGSSGPVANTGQLLGPFQFASKDLIAALAGAAGAPTPVSAALSTLFSGSGISLGSLATVVYFSSGAAATDSWRVNDPQNRRTFTILTAGVYGTNAQTPYPPEPACAPGSASSTTGSGSNTNCQPPSGWGD